MRQIDFYQDGCCERARLVETIPAGTSEAFVLKFPECERTSIYLEALGSVVGGCAVRLYATLSPRPDINAYANGDGTPISRILLAELGTPSWPYTNDGQLEAFTDGLRVPVSALIIEVDATDETTIFFEALQ